MKRTRKMDAADDKKESPVQQRVSASSASCDRDDAIASDDDDWLSKQVGHVLLSSKTTRTNYHHQRQQLLLQTEDVQEHTTSTSRTFTIVTWNIWFSIYQWKARLVDALVEILKQDPDVFCFQEVRDEVHQCMLQCSYIRKRYDPTEGSENLPHSYDCVIWVKKQQQNSSYSATTMNNSSRSSSSLSFTTRSIPIQSVYGRRGLCVDLEIPISTEGNNFSTRIRIVTTHLESGKEMEATRQRQLRTLLSHIQNDPWHQALTSSNIKRGEGAAAAEQVEATLTADVAFLVGDFNFDPSYPENKILEEGVDKRHQASSSSSSVGVSSKNVDLWKLLHPNDVGYTENTYRNRMRYMAHGKHKQVRYDRIIMKVQDERCHDNGDDDDMEVGDHHFRRRYCRTRISCQPTSIQLLGTEPFDENNEVWVSDHFGLVARVDLHVSTT